MGRSASRLERTRHRLLKTGNWVRVYADVLIRIGFALAIAFVVTRFRFDYLESLLYDGRMRLKPASQVSGKVVTIAVDRKTIDTLHHAPNAVDHTQLLLALRKHRPRAVVYLVAPIDLVGSRDELERFAKTAADTPRFIVAVDDAPMKGADDSFFHQPPPFDKLRVEAAPSTSDRNSFARDTVTRRMFTSYQGQPFMHLKLAMEFNSKIKDEDKVRGVFDFLEARQVYVDFRPAGTYSPVSFVDAANGNFGQLDVSDKIVIVGRDLRTTPKDYIRTPYSREINGMTTLEMHANMLDTLILNDGYIKMPEWINLKLTALISILTVWVVLALKPTRGLLLLGGTIVVFCLICFLAFWFGGLWITMAHPLLAAFICYYFFIPYRLIMENRRSWEYYQKNKLLTQVEELKTNFLSMMSHDLKTPIARIQGMTDVVLNDTNPLSERQTGALLTLKNSSEELLEFVSSILNLGRIESKELQLHMQSKDPNQLLTEIINKYEYLTKSKNIGISAELEPMFSVKMDVDLMRQVFSNLLENAIKYSPEGSRVLVTTEEHDGRVIIQVADQGMGIPEDEIAHVFSKFFRSKNAKSSNIKGSGLGLYLAKYFVELHKGKIHVDSSVGQGSTFTVELLSAAEN